MSRKRTTNEFVHLAKANHGSRYSYSKVDYKNSYTKVTIICSVHGDFRQTPAKHLAGQGCRLCGHIETGKKRTGSPSNPDNIVGLVAPHLLEEWDHHKNQKDVDPYYLGAGGGKQYWWLCPNGHSYSAVVKDRAMKRSGCPHCHKESREPNLLSNVDEPWVKEWHTTRNRPVKLVEVYKGSGKKYWWKCPKRHEPYLQSPSDRARGHGCPICGKEKVVAARTGRPSEANFTVAKAAPHLLSQWNAERNPSDVELPNWAAGSGKAFWWRCPFGHEWKAKISDRAIKNSGCPKCSNQTSTPEIAIYCELTTIFRRVLGGPGGYLLGKNLKVDVVVEDISLVIEYDGKRWHAGRKKREKDKRKTRRLVEMGYAVIRVREAPLRNIFDTDVEIIGGIDLKILVDKTLHSVLGLDNLTNRQRSDIRHYLGEPSLQAEPTIKQLVSQLPAPVYERSLEYLFLEIAKEWDAENLPITPRMVTHGSRRSVWWSCPSCAHKWKAPISNRTGTRKSKCPKCSRATVGQKISAVMTGKSRVGRKVAIDGLKFISVKQASEYYGLSERVVARRLGRGWTIRKALKTPMQKNTGKKIEFEGEIFISIKAAAHHYKLSPKAVEKRLKLGWTIRKSLLTPLNATKGRSRAKKVRVDSRTFPSITAAAEHYKVPRPTVSDRLGRGWSISRALKEPVSHRFK